MNGSYIHVHFGPCLSGTPNEIAILRVVYYSQWEIISPGLTKTVKQTHLPHNFWGLCLFRNIPCYYSSSTNRCQKLNCHKYNTVCQRNCTVHAAGLYNVPAMMGRRYPEHYLWVIIYTPDITAIYTVLDEIQRAFLSISVTVTTGACSPSTCFMANNAAS